MKFNFINYTSLHDWCWWWWLYWHLFVFSNLNNNNLFLNAIEQDKSSEVKIMKFPNMTLKIKNDFDPKKRNLNVAKFRNNLLRLYDKHVRPVKNSKSPSLVDINIKVLQINGLDEIYQVN